MPKKLHTLHDLFIEQLQDLYDAEHRILKALPKMQKAAHDTRLAEAFAHHFEQTQGHVERLDKVFKSIGETPKRKTCKAIKGLLAEGEEALKEKMEPEVRDAAIIAAAQRVEHYEMAGYGCAKAFAQQMNHGEAVSLLDATLQEEEETDALLSEIAEQEVNPAAMEPEHEGELVSV